MINIIRREIAFQKHCREVKKFLKAKWKPANEMALVVEQTDPVGIYTVKIDPKAEFVVEEMSAEDLYQHSLYLEHEKRKQKTKLINITTNGH